MLMRIVGLSAKVVTVQIRYGVEGWSQLGLTHSQFEEVMKNVFTDYYKDYEMSGQRKSCANFFYHYGETEMMLRKGIAFIYEAQD